MLYDARHLYSKMRYKYVKLQNAALWRQFNIKLHKLNSVVVRIMPAVGRVVNLWPVLVLLRPTWRQHSKGNTQNIHSTDHPLLIQVWRSSLNYLRLRLQAIALYVSCCPLWWFLSHLRRLISFSALPC